MRSNDLFISKFGLKSPLADKIITLFSKIIENGNIKKFYEWKLIFDKIYGNLSNSRKISDKIKDKFGLSTFNLNSFLFSVQTYYSIIIKLIAWGILSRIGKDFENNPLLSFSKGDLLLNLKKLETGEFYRNYGIVNFSTENIFSWYTSVWNGQIEKIISELILELSKFPFDETFLNDMHNLLQVFYLKLIPQQIRHQLGEFYTPKWLAKYLIDKIGYNGDPDKKLLDPSCGSGIFLILEIEKIKDYSNKYGMNGEELLLKILKNIVGFELNPLAIITSKINYLIAIRDLLPSRNKELEIPIYFYDAIKAPPYAFGFDYIIGNPPWINWEDLTKEYRESLINLWKKYGLFSLKGHIARFGGGRKDISMLFTYAVVDKYLKSNGKLGFLITQTVFKTLGAGEGFRRFQIGDKDYLKVIEVIDMVDLKPFKGASNMTAIIFLQKGAKTEYPIPYIKINKPNKPNSDINSINFSTHLKKECLYAEPITKFTSPWLTTHKSLLKLKRIIGPSPYLAYLGLNTGGANGIYWINIKEVDNSKVLIENRPEEGKKSVEKISFKIEKELIYPLIKSKNLRNWGLIGDYTFTIIVQDPKKRQGYKDLKKIFPSTYNYLKKFEDVLKARPMLKKYFKESAPFYSMFNIGTYTFAQYKVVWNRMGKRLKGTVVEPTNSRILGKRVVIPDNVLTFIPFTNITEAHYVCSIINSRLISFLIHNFSLKGGKSFAPPSILKYINIPKFDSATEIHLNLAELSKKAHSITKEKNRQGLKEVTQKIDELVYKLYKLEASEIEKLNNSM